MAPLFLAAKELGSNSLAEEIDVYLGFKEKAVLTDLFEKVAINNISIKNLIFIYYKTVFYTTCRQNNENDNMQNKFLLILV